MKPAGENTLLGRSFFFILFFEKVNTNKSEAGENTLLGVRSFYTFRWRGNANKGEGKRDEVNAIWISYLVADTHCSTKILLGWQFVLLKPQSPATLLGLE